MDSLQNSMAKMIEHFNTKMADFQKELQKANSSPTIKSLSSDFTLFKTFITSSMANFQKQFELLAQGQDRLERQCDHLETHGRRKILLIHGIAESPKENISSLVKSLAANKLKILDFKEADICRSHRLGRSRGQRPRPILLEFNSLAVRGKFWSAKTCLKGAGVTISEFLTKGRHEAYMAAREKFGVHKCWTRDGCVFVIDSDGVKHHVYSCAEVERLCNVVITAMEDNAASATSRAKK